MNIQKEANDILNKFGNTEMGHYKIQLMCEKYAEKIHQDKMEQKEKEISFCKNCKHFNQSNLTESKSNGVCLNLSNFLEDDENGVRLFNVNSDSTLMLVGEKFGCIHFEKEQV